MSEDEIQSHTFTGQLKGLHVVIFGGIHGNEPCGPKALERFANNVSSGKLVLTSGKVTIVPICNPRAHRKNVRYTEEDLNRIFKRNDHPKRYEEQLAQTLVSYIDEGDIFLDIHSTSASGPTSVFIDFPTSNNVALAKELRTSYALCNWPELYEKGGHGFESYDTTRYAFEAGKTGVIVECGQHDEPESVDFAYEAILRTLRYAKVLVDGVVEGDISTVRITMTALYGKEADEDTFSKLWRHLEPIPKGELIATRTSGEEVYATDDVIMLLPKHHAKKGQEWFYLGKVAST